ncbi:unnamed protein product [Callosobruchus maculatus]|uniref:Peptidase M14 domain-containing protein n=1 Tax=Callosobruchus maculatus TaxID=64391 RepID=A0A653BVZ0_CALMS|nr:unnamed protein product [Callosobruchus maculatus]
MRLLWLLNVTLVAFASALPKRYDNYVVYRVTPQSEKALESLRSLNKYEDVEFLIPLTKVGHTAAVLLPPQYQNIFLEEHRNLNDYINVEVVLQNVQEAIIDEGLRPESKAGSFDWDYYYTLDDDRFWRKTRTPVTKPSGKICIGIDPNRNWDFHFGEGGEICNDTYPGPYAFSETCTRELSNFLLNIPEKVQSYIGLHSYSEKILMPYSNSSEHLDNYDQVYKIAKEAAKVLKGVNGEDFGVGTAAEMLPQGSVVGASMDWVKEKMRVPYVVTYELRGKDFILPANQIIPASIETLQSILYSVKEAEHL